MPDAGTTFPRNRKRRLVQGLALAPPGLPSSDFAALFHPSSVAALSFRPSSAAAAFRPSFRPEAWHRAGPSCRPSCLLGEPQLAQQTFPSGQLQLPVQVPQLLVLVLVPQNQQANPLLGLVQVPELEP